MPFIFLVAIYCPSNSSWADTLKVFTADNQEQHLAEVTSSSTDSYTEITIIPGPYTKPDNHQATALPPWQHILRLLDKVRFHSQLLLRIYRNRVEVFTFDVTPQLILTANSDIIGHFSSLDQAISLIFNEGLCSLFMEQLYPTTPSTLDTIALPIYPQTNHPDTPLLLIDSLLALQISPQNPAGASSVVQVILTPDTGLAANATPIHQIILTLSAITEATQSEEGISVYKNSSYILNGEYPTNY